MLISLITIAVLHWAILLIPGFNFVLIGQLAAGGSRRASFAAVVGMTTVTLTWASLAVAGVGAIFSSQPVLRQAVQSAGGIYLLYLAFQLFRAGAMAGSAANQSANPWAAFRAGFVTSALNPKIALFYGSVFATALPAHPSPLHVLAAVALVYANSWIWHGSLALALSQRRVQSAYLRNYQLLTKCSALLVGGFGMHFLIASMQEVLASSAY